jgi:hypothetical protein
MTSRHTKNSDVKINIMLYRALPPAALLIRFVLLYVLSSFFLHIDLLNHLGPLGRVPLLETPKDLWGGLLYWRLRKISGEGFFTGDPKDLWGGLLTGDSERSLERYEKRYIKIPCKQVPLSTGTPLGNQEGIRFSALFG